MKKYSGIDLHSNNSVVVISDEEDRLFFENLFSDRLWHQAARRDVIIAILKADTVTLRSNRFSSSATKIWNYRLQAMGQVRQIVGCQMPL